MKTKRENPIPEKKTKLVDDLKNLIKNKKTILISSIKNLPSSQYQEIVKKLRGTAIVKVPKKNLIFRAIDNSRNKSVQEIKKQITESVAILFSDLNCFDLALELIKNKTPAKAKAGQIAPFDIEIKAGMTELVPGPAISELGAIGLVIKVTQGKLEITQDKIIVRKGEKISPKAADVMAKLDIKPFSIGFVPVCGFDVKENKLYLNIKIDKEETINNLKEAFGKALPFAVELGYVSNDTIKFLLGKAERNAKIFSKFENKVEENISKENSEENK